MHIVGKSGGGFESLDGDRFMDEEGESSSSRIFASPVLSDQRVVRHVFWGRFLDVLGFLDCCNVNFV